MASGEMGGTFPGTAALMILLNYLNHYQSTIPSWTPSKISSAGIGSLFLISGSSFSVSFTWLVNASFSEARIVWIMPSGCIVSIKCSIICGHYSQYICKNYQSMLTCTPACSLIIPIRTHLLLYTFFSIFLNWLLSLLLYLLF